MGIDPVPATQKLLGRLRLKIEQLDAIDSTRPLPRKASPCSGSWTSRRRSASHADRGVIALGHPLGMSGARLVQALVHQLEACGGRFGLATLCVGVGQCLALVVERT